MSYKEEGIAYSNDAAWVYRDKKRHLYVVYVNEVSSSLSDVAFPLTDDGLSLAIARADYIATWDRERLYRYTSSWFKRQYQYAV